MKANWGYRTNRSLWEELENLRRQMGQAFNDVFEVSREDMTCTTYPFLDILQKEGELVVMVDLPGLTKEDVQLQFEDNLLTISGVMSTSEAEDMKLVRNERFTGDFKRTIRANYKVDAENISAEMKNGQLIVKLPKHQAAQAKTINITVN